MASYTNPSVSDFKDYFVRDFPYGSGINNVRDADIQSGLNDALNWINPNLFINQSGYTCGNLLLSAHFMVLNLRASGAQNQGLAGQWSWLQASKAVGPVNESFSIPERIQANPELASLCKTYYGEKFLFMILPQLTGQCFSVSGRTHA